MRFCEITRLEAVENNLINNILGFINVNSLNTFNNLYPDDFTTWQNENAEGLSNDTTSIINKVFEDGPFLLVTGLTSYPPENFNEITDLINL